MKKFLGLIVALILMVSSLTLSFGQVLTANAQALDSADEYFTQFVLSDTTFEGELVYSHTPLYNEELQAHGREYSFSVGNVNGYALMVEFQGENNVYYEIEELFYYATSPFDNCVGLPVYITQNVYLEYKEQAFFDITTDNQLSIDVVAELAIKGFNYFGGVSANYTEVTSIINYATKSTTTYSIQYDLPNIIGSVQGGSCAHTAGQVILIYYDRFYENIIPNFTSYLVLNGYIVYRNSSPEITAMGLQLVDYMLIGEPHTGTTFSEFQLGMETYVEQQGYTYSSTNLFSNGSFNFNNYKTAVESGKPCAIFLTNYAMLNGVNQIAEGQDEISSGYCPVSHVVAGCGYKIDTYYDENNSVIDTRTYLKVACGSITYGIGYLNINGVSTISKAISILVS